MAGHADDDTGRAPFLDNSCDCCVVDTLVAIANNPKRGSGTGDILTDGNAYPAQAEIKCEYCSGLRQIRRGRLLAKY